MEFSHFNDSGRARMVSVGEKQNTQRQAVAKGTIIMQPETIERIKSGTMKKGDVLAVAQVGGIMGAKKTSDIIPMCHNIFISGCDIDFVILSDRIEIIATARTYGQTGIEMEALTAVSVAALTIYDMCKAVDKHMIIDQVRLIKKTGGNSGTFIREDETMKAYVKSINISDKKGVIKTPIDSAVFVEEFGIEGDAHGGKGNRQVSLLAQESIDKMEKNTGIQGLCNGKFAENLTTHGLELYTLPIGTRLKIGETIQEVSQIGKECHAGCEIMKQVGQCIMPKEGIFTKVIQGGTVKSGDTIEIMK